MLNYDLSPFYRSTVGFDRLFSMLDRVAGGDQNAPTYPPYNIERTDENAYRITLAVAGFAEDELSVETRENTLTVRGSKEASAGRRRQARGPLSGDRGARVRAPVSARRPCRRHRRGQRQWSAAHRPGARGPRGSEAPHHRDQQERQDHRSRQDRPPRRPRNTRGDAQRHQGVPSGAPFFVYSNSAGGRRSPLPSLSPRWRPASIRPVSLRRVEREAAAAALTIGVLVCGSLVATGFGFCFAPAGASPGDRTG